MSRNLKDLNALGINVGFIIIYMARHSIIIISKSLSRKANVYRSVSIFFLNSDWPIKKISDQRGIVIFFNSFWRMGKWHFAKYIQFSNQGETQTTLFHILSNAFTHSSKPFHFLKTFSTLIPIEKQNLIQTIVISDIVIKFRHN